MTGVIGGYRARLLVDNTSSKAAALDLGSEGPGPRGRQDSEGLQPRARTVVNSTRTTPVCIRLGPPGCCRWAEAGGGLVFDVGSAARQRRRRGGRGAVVASAAAPSGGGHKGVGWHKGAGARAQGPLSSLSFILAPSSWRLLRWRLVMSRILWQESFWPRSRCR